MPKPESATESQMARDKDASNLSRPFKYLMATQFLSRGILVDREASYRRGLCGEYPDKTRKLGIYLTEALKLVLLIGTSEAFLHAVANESQLKKSNDSLLLFSLIYVMLNFLLIRSFGVVGLIFANSIRVLTLISERLFLEQQKFWSTFLLHLSIGLVCFIVSLLVIYRRERSFINKIIRFHQHSD